MSLLSGILDFGKNVYNLFTNERDFNYQKSLQKDIFNREDNAVQRRVEDLNAAGLNPALALGSSAGAGQVVGRSNTPDLNGILDTMQAEAQIKRSKIETDYIKAEKHGQDLINDAQEISNIYQQHKLLREMGLPSLPYIEDGKLGLTLSEGTSDGSNIDNKYWSDRLRYEDTYGSITRENSSVNIGQFAQELNYLTTNMNFQNMTFNQALNSIKEKNNIIMDTFQMEQKLRDFGLEYKEFEYKYNQLSASERTSLIRALSFLLFL